jgi:hypothetical protein
MVNKKTLKRNKRSKNKTGSGFSDWFTSKKNSPETVCNQNELVNLRTSGEMHTKYLNCCKKSFFGSKNNSPYCKQLDLNFQAKLKQENNSNGYYGSENESRQSVDLRASDITGLEHAIGPNKNNINCDDTNYPQLLTSPDKIKDYLEICKCDNVPFWKPSRKKNCKVVFNKKNNNENNNQKQNNIQNFIQRFPPQVWGYRVDRLNSLDLKSVERKLEGQITDFLDKYPMDNFFYEKEELRALGPRKMLQKLKNQFKNNYPPAENDYTIDQLNSDDPSRLMNDIIEYKREENNLNPLSGYMWSHPETGQAYYDNEGYNQEVLYDEELRKREEEKKRQITEMINKGNDNNYSQIPTQAAGKRRTKKYLINRSIKKQQRKTRKY